MKVPNLHDVLYDAQGGKCWLGTRCWLELARMHRTPADPNSDFRSTLDHLWPTARWGAQGNVGVVLLAHAYCNSKRGHRPADDNDIRTLIDVYSRIPGWWMDMTLRGAIRDLKEARRMALRVELLTTLIEART